ncbi:MAG: hypothetical protein BCS36_09835 [Desulfovibrio sp. MES5]|nr:MAG: hypothetical protein BCS36_09835 [Desulfovibrio sp. MES5]
MPRAPAVCTMRFFTQAFCAGLLRLRFPLPRCCAQCRAPPGRSRHVPHVVQMPCTRDAGSPSCLHAVCSCANEPPFLPKNPYGHTQVMPFRIFARQHRLEQPALYLRQKKAYT